MTSPTVRRWQLGQELRRLRELAGYTRHQAADIIDTSSTRMGSLESGRNVPTKLELAVLLRDHYGVDQETLDSLEQLRREGRSRGWWSGLSLPEWLALYIGLETGASTVKAVHEGLIPGLLQHEEYATALCRMNLSAEILAREGNGPLRWVESKRARQQRLVAPTKPLHLMAVVSESALIRCAHSPSFGAAQLAHLVDQSKIPTVDFRVVPLDVGVHPGMEGSFTLLGFPSGILNPVVYREAPGGGHLTDDPESAKQCEEMFQTIQDQALSPSDTLTLLTALSAEHPVEETNHHD